MNPRPVLPALLAIVLSATASAGAPEMKAPIPAVTAVPLSVVNLRSSYTFESDFQQGDDAAGDSWFNSATVQHRFPLGWSWLAMPDAGWYLRLGAQYGRFDFNNSGGLPLPDTLQNANAILAVEYLVAGEIAILLETAPGFYFEENPDGDSFDAPTKLAVAFPLTPRFFLVAGATYRGAIEKYPFFPVLGALWLINDEWTLRLIAPAPRLIYRPAEHLRLWVGGELGGGAYRVDDDPSRPAELRHAVLTYSEIKVGAGFTWGDPDRVALDVGAGYNIRRKFDYFRAEKGYETDEGAPYLRVSFTAGF